MLKEVVTFNNIYQLFQDRKLYADTPIPDPKGKIRALVTPITFQLSNGQRITALPGFEWDEQSVPWLGLPVFPKSGIYAPSALPHDILYYLTIHNRLWVEEEFKKWMIATKLPTDQINFRYWIVKNFGHRFWNKNLRNPGERCLRNRTLLQVA